jgi:site-specific recombinase XerD
LDISGNDLVFSNEHGGYWLEQTVERNLRNFMLKAGLDPRITPHKLRHSTGSILFALGVDPKVIQEILGHGKIGTTMDTYVHLKPTAQREAMAKLNSAFEKGKKREAQ